MKKDVKKQKMKTGERLNIPPFKPILLFNGVTLVLAASTLFGMYRTEWDWNTPVIWIVIGFWVAILITTIVFFTRSNYYIVTADGIEHQRFNEKKTYSYKNVLYIDEEWSKKHKKLYFLTNEGIEKFLAFDREGKIYTLFMKHCKNLISTSQVRSRFPTLKISLTKEEKEIEKAQEKEEKRLEKEAIKAQKQKRK